MQVSAMNELTSRERMYRVTTLLKNYQIYQIRLRNLKFSDQKEFLKRVDPTKEIEQLEKLIQAIEDGLNTCNDLEMDYIDLFYFREQKQSYVCDKLAISVSKATDVNRSIIRKIYLTCEPFFYYEPYSVLKTNKR